MSDDLMLIIERILRFRENKNGSIHARKTTAREIFQGSYDVWSSKEEASKYVFIKDNLINEAQRTGLIETTSKNVDWNYYKDEWEVTELGKAKYQEYISTK